MSRVPPHNLDAEAAVLSAILLNRDVLDDVRALVSAEDFYAECNKRIYETILELDGAGKPVDIVLVAGALRDKNRLNQVGGTEYLAQISDATPTIGHIEDHALIVRNKALVRRVIAACQTIAAEGYGDVGEVSGWLQGVEARILDVTQQIRPAETLETMFEIISRESSNMFDRQSNAGEIAGIPTGYRDLDRKIGGWKNGLLYTLAGRPGSGKSALALGSLIKVAEHGLELLKKGERGYGSVLFSLEMPAEQTAQRAICQQANLDTGLVERGGLNKDEWEDATAAFDHLGKLPMVIESSGEHTVASVRAGARRALRRLRQQFGENIDLGLLVLDYLQIMTPKDKEGRSRENDVTELSNGMRALAKELNCPVIQLSQLNRDCEKREDKRPKVADLRESGSIEQDSFGIILIYRDDMYKKPGEKHDGEAEAIIGKLRQGGGCGTVKMGFQDFSARFYDIEPKIDGYNYNEDNFGSSF